MLTLALFANLAAADPATDETPPAEAPAKPTIQVQGRVQPRLTVTTGGPEGTEVEALPRRVRLKVKGTLLDGDLALYVQAGWDRGVPALVDAWADARLGGGVYLRAGQMKRPFGRDFIMSSNKLALVDRGIHHSAFEQDRDVGAMLHTSDEERLEAVLGVYHGGGPASTSPDAFGPQLVGRLALHTQGADPYTQVAVTEGLQASVGLNLGLGFDTNHDDEGQDSDVDPHVQVGLDGLARLGRLTLMGAALARTEAKEGPHELHQVGGHADAHVLIGERHVPAARYAVVVPIGTDLPVEHELTAGYSYLFDGNKIKWVTDAALLLGAEPGVRARTQLEVNL